MQSRNSSNYMGIDISHWNGSIDFEKVKNSGIKIVYMKATQGDTYIDPMFITNARNAKDNGLLVGYYHYFTATTESGAIDEAIHFVSTTKPYHCDCKMAIDIEVNNGLDGSTLSKLCKIFLDKVTSLSGLDVVIYTYTSFISEYLQSYLGSYPLWIAEYGVDTPTSDNIWSTWVGFQYSDNGDINGVDGAVDLDEFTNSILLNSSSNNHNNHDISDPNKDSSHNPPKKDESCIRYTVKPGDTLSQIALNFGSTVQHIADLNHISDPNLIYVGQILVICKYSKIPKEDNQPIRYIVKFGDTLSQIAIRFNTTVERLVELNHIQNPNLIYAGQILVI